MKPKDQNNNSMTEYNTDDVDPLRNDTKHMNRRRCLIALGVLLLLLLLLFITILILFLTFFKYKKPKIQLLSADVDGVAPRISIPMVQIQINLTLNLEFLVKNPNHASFKHAQGKSILLYQGTQVGDADIYPGHIPATGSATLPSRLVVRVDQLASNFMTLMAEVMANNLVMETDTRIPGKVILLGIFKKHAVAESRCQITIAVLDMNITSQICNIKTKL